MANQRRNNSKYNHQKIVAWYRRCEKCGYTWLQNHPAEGKTTTCPNCKTELNVRDSIIEVTEKDKLVGTGLR